MLFSSKVLLDAMSYSWRTLFFASILLLSTSFTALQASAYDSSSTTTGQMINSSSYAHPSNLPHFFTKENGTDLEIKATVYNPINLYGNVTDPNGMVHQMSVTTSEKGMTQLRFYASISDPNGVYVARFQLIQGPASSGMVVAGGPLYYQKQSPPVSTPPISSMSPIKQITKGVLPQNVVCSNGLVLVKKPFENSVACVKLQTAEKLVERGWTNLSYQDISNLSMANSTLQEQLKGTCIGGPGMCK